MASATIFTNSLDESLLAQVNIAQGDELEHLCKTLTMNVSPSRVIDSRRVVSCRVVASDTLYPMFCTALPCLFVLLDKG